MAAATAPRDTKRLAQDGQTTAPMNYPVNGGDIILQGTLACLNTEGNLVPAVTATGLVCVGRAEASAIATGLVDGVLRLDVREGIYPWFSGTSADLILADDVGKNCYIIDNQTVGLTSGTNTRSPAGVIYRVDADGVWVKSSIEISRGILDYDINVD